MSNADYGGASSDESAVVMGPIDEEFGRQVVIDNAAQDAFYRIHDRTQAATD